MDASMIKKQLSDTNIRPTYQRIKILEYLNQNHNHPTAEEIYTNLYREMPSLSKTTVYNTLNTLVEKKILNEIKIGNSDAHYDLNMKPHGHFRCINCHKIFDFPVEMNLQAPKELEGFKIESKSVSFTGFCPSCKK